MFTPGCKRVTELRTVEVQSVREEGKESGKNHASFDQVQCQSRR